MPAVVLVLTTIISKPIKLMNNYIKQLLELIDDSIRNALNNTDCSNDIDCENNYEFADEFLSGTPEKIASIVGIDKYHFPTSDKLSNKQIDKIYHAIEKLLLSYNLEFMFPEKVNNKIKYQFIIDHWNSEHIYCKQATVQIETCKFDESNCPFPGHCNVCESFKCENDASYPLDKGLIDFNSLIPNISEEQEKQIREDVDKFKMLMKQPLNENYISGIHNYCDGRCKKCQFTNKCSSFSLNQELDKLIQKSEQGKKAVNNQLMVMLQASSEIIEEELIKRGIKIDEALEDITELKSLQISKHGVEKLAESYAEKVKRWLESNQLEIESRLIKKPNTEIHNYVETITWFQLFIPAKVNRAINGLNKDNSINLESFDAKGSAKITLIAIDECIIAWSQLLKYIPKKEDSILNILKHLSKLKQELLILFPRVMDFIRPGLD